MLASEIAAHSSLRRLIFWYAYPLRAFAALDAIVDAVLKLRLTKLCLVGGSQGPAAAAALPRLLLSGDALRELAVYGDHTMLLDTHVAPLLADALRTNRTLTSLTLLGVRLFHEAAMADAVLGALIGHTSVTCIMLNSNNAVGVIADGVGAHLGALVAAASPLSALDITMSWRTFAWAR